MCVCVYKVTHADFWALKLINDITHSSMLVFNVVRLLCAGFGTVCSVRGLMDVMKQNFLGEKQTFEK